MSGNGADLGALYQAILAVAAGLRSIQAEVETEAAPRAARDPWVSVPLSRPPRPAVVSVSKGATHADDPSHSGLSVLLLQPGPGRATAHPRRERDKVAKYWLAPVELARSEGFRAHELNRVRALVVEHRILFQEAWDEHFRSQSGED